MRCWSFEVGSISRGSKEFQTSVLCVAVRGGPTMLARIGIMKALNRHEVREFKTSEKKTHWGKRKLARDR
jgi:hypothetical protein